MIPLKVSRLKKMFTRFLLSFTAAILIFNRFGQITLTTANLYSSIQIASLVAIVGLIFSFTPVGEL